MNIPTTEQRLKGENMTRCYCPDQDDLGVCLDCGKIGKPGYYTVLSAIWSLMRDAMEEYRTDDLIYWATYYKKVVGL